MDFPRHYNAAEDLIDRNVANGLGDKTAFIDTNSAITYSQLGEQTCRFANALQALQIGRERRIAVLMLDRVSWPIVFLGAIRAGVVPVALNTLLTPAQYEFMLADSRAEALVVSAELLPQVTPILDKLTDLRHVIVADGDQGPYRSLETVLEASSADFTPVKTICDEEAFWLYSSGSTGNPKGVRHVHSSIMETALTYGKEVLNITADDVVLSAAKLFFAYGLGNALSFPMSVGATTILHPGRPTPDDMLSLMKQHQTSLFFGVPTLYAAMLADENCQPENASEKLRLCISAGEALPADVGQAWQKRFSVPVLDGIGSTEMLHIFLSNRVDALKYGTTGIAVPGYEAKLVDENGKTCEVNEIGELLIAGNSVANGYWNQREKSFNAFQGRYSRTGDKYFRDEDGYFVYCGRTDDMFKVSGIWVSPFEVEQALVSHPDVLEAACVAKEDAEGLVKPKAYVVLNKGVGADGMYEPLKEHVKAAIGAWKYPRWIEFTDDLPKTATGKIQRFKLRD